MKIEEAFSLNSVKCSAFLWSYPNDHSWEEWDALVINTFKTIRSFQTVQKDHPLLLQTIHNNLQLAKEWRKFTQTVTSPNASVIEGYLNHIKSLPTVDVDFDCPDTITDVCWLVENVLQRNLTRMNASLEELSDISLGIGRNIIMLANLTSKKMIRRDQAGKILELCLSPVYMTLSLDELLYRDEFSGIIDEATIDDGVLTIIDSVLVEEEKAVEQIKAGKEKAIGSIIGKVMKQVKIDPRVLKDLVLERIG